MPGKTWFSDEDLKRFKELMDSFTVTGVMIVLEVDEVKALINRLGAAEAICQQVEIYVNEETPEMSKCGHSEYWMGHFGTCMACSRDRWKSRAEELANAGKLLLQGHDNLYLAHFGTQFKNADPLIDIAAKPMRKAIAAYEEDLKR